MVCNSVIESLAGPSRKAFGEPSSPVLPSAHRWSCLLPQQRCHSSRLEGVV